MDIAFTDTPVARATNDTWSATYDHTYLEDNIHQAYAYAASVKHEVLVSITLPVSPCDPLRMFNAFAQLGIGERFYWERPAEQRALVGVGVTRTIETSGPRCVTNAAAAWRELQARSFVRIAPGAVPLHTSGPVLVGGFTFDVLNTHTDLWRGFPDGLLILPSMLFHCEEESAALTFNVVLAPSQPSPPLEREAAAGRLVAEIEEQLQHVQAMLPFSAVEEFAVQPGELAMQDMLPAAEWRAMVAGAVNKIREGAFEKVVLARAVRIRRDDPFDVPATLLRLRQSYAGAHIFAVQRGERYFVGATPERLVCGVDGQIKTMALAGSARRGATEEEDERLGQQELLHNPKNQAEHHVVVTTIQNSLARLCSRVWVADAPHLLKLKNIQHLETPIIGDLLPGHSILEAIEDLHPTPAVGGYPRLPALEAIRAIEHLDRGWYASPIGWIGTSGNGEFAVALRSALVDGASATLFAGCGIVADSDPESEYQESCLKLQVMLRGLGGEQ
ncbi:MAG: isochorismate synthase [Ktedonobacteraceae bacterium]